jgi:hypothetical protein
MVHFFSSTMTLGDLGSIFFGSSTDSVSMKPCYSSLIKFCAADGSSTSFWLDLGHSSFCLPAFD